MGPAVFVKIQILMGVLSVCCSSDCSVQTSLVLLFRMRRRELRPWVAAWSGLEPGGSMGASLSPELLVRESLHSFLRLALLFNYKILIF